MLNKANQRIQKLRHHNCFVQHQFEYVLLWYICLQKEKYQEGYTVSDFFIWMLTDSLSQQNDSVITQTKRLNSSNWVCSWDKTNQYSQWNTNSELQEDEHYPSWRIVNIPVWKLVLFVQECACVRACSFSISLVTHCRQQWHHSKCPSSCLNRCIVHVSLSLWHRPLLLRELKQPPFWLEGAGPWLMGGASW